MKIITMTFGGRPVKILVGHEDFEILFIGEQIAEICHLSDYATAKAMTMDVTSGYGFVQLREVLSLVTNPDQLGKWGIEKEPGDTWLTSGAASYRMLLRLDSPFESIFCQWVKENVLPDIREMRQTGEIIEPPAEKPSDYELLRVEARLLKRRLDAEVSNNSLLRSTLEVLDKKVIELTKEVLSLKKGMPFLRQETDATGSFLCKLQSEFDHQAFGWRRQVWREEALLQRAKFDEHAYRLQALKKI